MNKIAKLKALADSRNGLLRYADLRTLKICYRTAQRLVERGILEIVKTGCYRFSDSNRQLSEAEMIEQLFPDGILCQETALFHYGYSDRKPDHWDLAFDKDVSKSRFKLKYPKIKPHFFEPEHLQYGVETIIFEKAMLRIFSRERIYCECLLNQSKMDFRIYEPAVLRYMNDRNKNMTKLMACAARRHVLYRVIKIFEIDLE